MEWDPQKVLLNVRNADTEDLIDRITAYRNGMEPEAIAIIEQELRRRNVNDAAIRAHEERYRTECLHYADGTAKMCSFCRRPAIREGWGWHWLWGKIPLTMRPLRYCHEHAKDPRTK